MRLQAFFLISISYTYIYITMVVIAGDEEDFNPLFFLFFFLSRNETIRYYPVQEIINYHLEVDRRKLRPTKCIDEDKMLA
jgi:hypothetical protein